MEPGGEQLIDERYRAVAHRLVRLRPRRPCVRRPRHPLHGVDVSDSDPLRMTSSSHDFPEAARRDLVEWNTGDLRDPHRIRREGHGTSGARRPCSIRTRASSSPTIGRSTSIPAASRRSSRRGRVRLMQHPANRGGRPISWSSLIALLSLPLFFYGLGATYLWQDEAQTALLGRSVLAHGVPMVGDGCREPVCVRGTDAGIGGDLFSDRMATGVRRGGELQDVLGNRAGRRACRLRWPAGCASRSLHGRCERRTRGPSRPGLPRC